MCKKDVHSEQYMNCSWTNNANFQHHVIFRQTGKEAGDEIHMQRDWGNSAHFCIFGGNVNF